MAFVSVDQIAARFPQFRRSGAAIGIAAIARAAGVVSVTTASDHGAQAGWSAVITGVVGSAGTEFDDTFAVLAVVSSTQFTVAQLGLADDTGSGGQASLARPGAISDGQIMHWAEESADYIGAIAAGRGYDLANLPPATAPQALTILQNLNKLGAQVLLGEAIQSTAGMTNEWVLLRDIRVEQQMLQKSFGAGAYDRLFVSNARTQDTEPQLGGYVPGIGPPPRTHVIFRKDKLL